MEIKRYVQLIHRIYINKIPLSKNTNTNNNNNNNNNNDDNN